MRLVLTLGLYLAYIQTFCGYLLTGQYDWLPADPAGLLAHAAQLDKVLARPDGVFLCALFALGCYGVAGCLVSVLREMETWLFHAPSHVHYDLGRGPGKMASISERKAVLAQQGGAMPAPPAASPTFTDYVGPGTPPPGANASKTESAPEQPPK